MARKKKTPRDKTIRLKDGSIFVFPEGGDMIDFGQQVRDAIKQAGLSQYYLAKLTGIPQAALSNFLNGKDLRLSTFNKLCHVLGFELNQNTDTSPKRLD